MADTGYPLAGLRVLDLSSGVAGPFCTKIMGAMGAEVLKLEKPGLGDEARSMPPFYHDEPDLEKSGLFLYLNTNKWSATLNLEEPAGRAMFKRLVATAHVVVEDFKPGVMEHWGLGYAELEKINPKIILTSVTGYGQDGPYRDYESTDLVASALGGILYITGEQAREPLKIGGQPMLYFAGLGAWLGTMSAVHYQEATGQGQHVDVSIMDAVGVAQMYSALSYAYRKENRGRVQDFSPLFKAKDGYVGMMYRQQNWEDICHWIGRPDLIDDPKFNNFTGRQENMQELNAIVAEWIKDQPKAEIYHTGQALRMPLGFISDARDLLESPQYIDREYFIQVDHPATGPVTYPGMPIKMTGMEWHIKRAPLLGENNEDIFCNMLGYTKQDLGVLRAAGII